MKQHKKHQNQPKPKKAQKIILLILTAHTLAQLAPIDPTVTVSTDPTLTARLKFQKPLGSSQAGSVYVAENGKVKRLDFSTYSVTTSGEILDSTDQATNFHDLVYDPNGFLIVMSGGRVVKSCAVLAAGVQPCVTEKTGTGSFALTNNRELMFFNDNEGTQRLLLKTGILDTWEYFSGNAQGSKLGNKVTAYALPAGEDIYMLEVTMGNRFLVGIMDDPTPDNMYVFTLKIQGNSFVQLDQTTGHLRNSYDKLVNHGLASGGYENCMIYGKGRKSSVLSRIENNGVITELDEYTIPAEDEIFTVETVNQTRAVFMKRTTGGSQFLEIFDFALSGIVELYTFDFTTYIVKNSIWQVPGEDFFIMYTSFTLIGNSDLVTFRVIHLNCYYIGGTSAPECMPFECETLGHCTDRHNQCYDPWLPTAFGRGLGDGCIACEQNALNCKECEPGYTLNNPGTGEAECVKDCPVEQGFTVSDSSCYLCSLIDSRCLECGYRNTLSDPMVCRVCENDGPQEYEASFNGAGDSICKKVCGPGEFWVEPNNCVGCHGSCQTCDGPGEDQCLVCQAGLKLQADFRCLAECDSGTFEVTEGVCYPCSHTCLECEGLSSRHCLSCPPGQLLGIDGSCGDTCGSGSAPLDSTHCRACYGFCDSCTDFSPSGCTVCSTGAVRHLDDNICVPECRIQHYEDENSYCQKCHHSCEYCTGPLENQCLSCFPQADYQTVEKTCLTKEGFYLTEEGYLLCDRSCKSCSGESENECLSCYEERFLTPENTCVQFCPESTYLKEENGNFSCDSCHESCQSCLSNSEEDCQSCPTTGTYRFIEDEQINKGRCVDCSLEGAGEDCPMTRSISLKKLEKSIDGFSSVSVEIDIGDTSEFITSLQALDLSLYFNNKIEQLIKDQDYFSRLEIYKEKRIVLSLNFTKDGHRVLLTSSPAIHAIIPTQENEPYLILLNKTATLSLEQSAPENPIIINKATDKFITTAGVTATVASTFLLMLAILSSSRTLASPILNIFKIFKLIYLLRLINVYFGNILEGFLRMLSAGLGSQAIPERTDWALMTKTRGKLSMYLLSPIANKYVALKYLLYLLSKLAHLTYFLFKREIKIIDNLDSGILTLMKFLENGSSAFYFSNVFDLVFFSAHELLHHDMTVRNDSLASQSYWISFVIFTLLMVDSLYMMIQIQELDMKKLTEIEEKIESINQKIETSTNRIRIGKFHKIKEKLDKRKGYSYGLSIEFLTLEIEKKKVKGNSIFDKSPKLVSIFKVILFSILINSLQLFPNLQIMSIFLIQVTHIIYLIHLGFRKKIFKHRFSFIFELTTELSVLTFLLSGLLIKFKTRENFKVENYTKLQICCILLILIALLLYVINSIFLYYLALKKIQRELKLSKGRKLNAKMSLLAQKRRFAENKRIEIFERNIGSEFSEGEEEKFENEVLKKRAKKQVKIKNKKKNGLAIGGGMKAKKFKRNFRNMDVWRQKKLRKQRLKQKNLVIKFGRVKMMLKGLSKKK